MSKIDTVKVIGAGLAGCEAAYQLAKRGIKVTLVECKPKTMSAAHKSTGFAELVCSNSLKSTLLTTSQGLLKAELEVLDSFVLRVARENSVPAGSALAVDREKFSKAITSEILKNSLVTVLTKTVEKIDPNEYTIVATGPLTLGNLLNEFEDNLYFFDAAAPIISGDSVDNDVTFIEDRYQKGDSDYINCPLSRDEYYIFVNALVEAKTVPLKEFELKIFEGCVPIEVLASRGKDTLRFGPLKPVGLVEPKSSRRPFAVVQLRKENQQGTMLNLVGFQTNLTFTEQRRVFSLIPALKNAEFLRYGVMHRNTYINAPRVINSNFQTIKYPKVYVAGQLSGVEGYLESVASGLMAARFISGEASPLPNTTMIGALIKYITTPTKDFQPMNANFGLLPPLEVHIKDKLKRKEALSERATKEIKKYVEVQKK